jgi:hypothetical protein
MTLRIDLAGGSDPATMVLQGRLSVAEVAVFEKTAAEAGLPLCLDLGQLLGADAEGLRALRRQQRRGALFTGVSPYMELLLEMTVWGAEDESEK